ncbi:glycosyltransferase [Pedobacter xixiisoli]|uniref:Glycosyltransferase involved in cell wall bisynthesis n=1 Tax=Pedobacter xixiisoli TaxID=1476464 RepID=A0A286A9M5_9SPHI|nr:glycosyltransferase [Pedobacter xixiisoli]SOD18618.1 Glycosyltransferase involved in cell wall bisynthesis [Pedobacter xixiisoli]
MRIALTVDPEIAVPPIHYGGIERIVDFLITEYQEKGHEITLFANDQSRKDCILKVWPGKTSFSKIDTLRNTIYLTREYLKNKYDIVHSFSRLAYLTLILPIGAKCIMSYQREPTISQIIKAKKLAFAKNLWFTGCSDYITDQIKPFASAFKVFNGVPLAAFHFNEAIHEDAPLVFLGRIEPIKGTHNAITIAQQTGKKLVIAGNIPQEYQWYYNEKVEPHLSDQIKYIGPVNDEQKNNLLRHALAFVMAIQWNEPFGIVMAEASACGTPIIGTCKGAVNEFITDGLNGFKSDEIEGLVRYVNEIHLLDRRQIRIDTEKRFSSNVIAEQYLQLYKNFISK